MKSEWGLQEETVKKIAIGCDPNAAQLKEIIKKHLTDLGYEYEDYGSDDPVYANVAIRVAEAVARGKHDRGILACGTGIGMSITANKLPNVRASLVTNEEMARLARSHNDANVLTMGGRILGRDEVRAIVRIWLQTPFKGGRHVRRVEKIAEIEGRTGHKD